MVKLIFLIISILKKSKLILLKSRNKLIQIYFTYIESSTPDNVITECLYKKGAEDEYFNPEEKLNYKGVLSCKVFCVDEKSQPAACMVAVTPEAIAKGKAYFGVKKDKVFFFFEVFFFYGFLFFLWVFFFQ